MANSLWVGAVRKGLAADKPTVPDFPSDTFGFYYETDNEALYFGVSGGEEWLSLSTVTGNAVLANLPTTDPAVLGDLWNDGGVLAVSTGA